MGFQNVFCFMNKRYFIILLFPFLSFNECFSKSSYLLMEKDKPFTEQCVFENTIYDIREDFDLRGAIVRIPKSSVLELNGGSINNGTIVLSSDTKIVGTGEKLNRLLITIDSKMVKNVLINGIELVGYKNSAKKNDDLVSGIRVNLGASVNNFTVSNCVIHGYNTGISARGSNVFIKDNLLYDNGHQGTVAQVHDSEIDIAAGYNANNVSSSNFLVTGNRCLSKYVHRNIDCGELLSEDNIIISNNICVSMNGLTEEASDDVFKSQCILVGYTGTSRKDKAVIISNNICKNCNWAAIYVRANNTDDTVGANGYLALITNNVIENVVKDSKSSFGAGIACELREGSVITNNIIKNCSQGINIGQVLSNGHVKISGNSIDNCNYGIINDSVANKIDISDNSITNVSRKGIAISEATVISGNTPNKYIYISNNIITLRKNNTSITNVYSDDNPSGIFLYNIGANCYSVNSNSIHSDNPLTNVGIMLLCNAKDSYVTINGNRISGCVYGVVKKADSEPRNDKCRMIENGFVNCAQAFSIGANSKKQLFVVERSQYEGCGSRFGDQTWARMVFDGEVKPDGSYVLFDDCQVDSFSSKYGKIPNAPLCFLEKSFMKGDVVIPRNKEYFSSATCSGTSGNSSFLWRFENASLPDYLLDACALPGQIVYSTSSKTLLYYVNSWHAL